MIKTIVVNVAGTSQSATALDTAVAFGRLCDAHVECFRIHPDPTQMLAEASAADMGSSMAIAELWQGLQDDDKRRTKAARDAFDAVCAREKISLLERPAATVGFSAAWHEETGDEIDRLVRRARFFDVAVIEHPSGGGGFLPGSAGAVLIGAGRPLLVAPPSASKTIARNIVIGWKDTPEAARAVAAAIPVLARAEKIMVLGVNEDDSEEARARLSLENLANYLAWHKIAAERRLVPVSGGGAADTLLREAQSLNADLLVMGGYGHSRMRELIFGGITRRVFSGVSLPVFLVH